MPIFINTTQAERLWQSKDLTEFAGEMAKQIEDRERKLYSAIPDSINCSDHQWLSSKRCKNLNFIIKKSSGPVAIPTKSGSTINLAPGTPLEIVPFLLDPTMKNAVKAISFNKQLLEDKKRRDKLSTIAKSVIALKTKSDKDPEHFIEESSLRITAILDLDDPSYLSVINNVKRVKSQYPGITTSYYFKSTDINLVKEVNLGHGIAGRLMKISDLSKVKTPLPTVWIDNLKTRFRQPLSGVITVPEILQSSEVVSNAHIYKFEDELL